MLHQFHKYLIKKTHQQVGLTALLMLIVNGAFAEPVKLNLFTEEFPPLQIKVYGAPKGYVVDFAHAVIEDAAQTLPMEINSIHFVPWKRALKKTKESANSLLFSISRTKSREEKYHWIGEISPYEVVIFKHKNGPQTKSDTLQDLLNYRFGVQAGGSFEEYLKNQGVKNLATVTYGRRTIKLLDANRIDFAPIVSQSHFYRMEQYGFDPKDFVPVYKIEELSKKLWLVAGKKTPIEVVKALQNSHKKLMRQDLLGQMIASYHPESKIMRAYRHEKIQERFDKGK